MTQRKLVDGLRAETGLSQFMICVETVEVAKDRKDFNGLEYFFCELSDAVINEVQKVLPENINLHGAQHSLTTEDVWHMYRGHCLDSFITDDQISITFDDIRMIPDIVRNYDSVIADKNSGKWSLVFLKQYGDVTYKYVTNISRKLDSSKIRHITLKTGWLIKSTGAEDDFTSRQSQTQGVSHFPRTVVITPMEENIKQNYPDEARKIAKYAKEHDRTLHAPNGKISNLTPVQWLAVRLQSFKDWFGDWENDPENASKVVDENGSVFWGRLPELEALKDKGYAGLNLLLRLGYKNDWFNHIVNLHGQWIMVAMGIVDPIIACKRYISTVLNSVKKINYITNGARDSLVVKSGEFERYFIVAVGKDRVDS